MASQSQVITRTLEPGTSYFGAVEIRVALLPVGNIPDDVFQKYASLVMVHRQVELNNVRSFYKEAQKSPFNFFPWKRGLMHFRFMPAEEAARPSPLAPLHAHRRILGVIGILSCKHAGPDLAAHYSDFETQCRAYPDAATIRCFAVDPDEAQVTQDHKARPDLILFPPGPDGDHLAHHVEVVMHDFAACVLGDLERWMLNASPAGASLSTLVDTAEFTGVPLPPYAGEDDAARTKRKYARLQKAMGDHSLLAGSPLDALDHYNTAVELGKTSNDWTFAAAAAEGYAAAKLLHAAAQHDAFASNAESVFRNEGAWRTPRNSEEESGGGGGGGGEDDVAKGKDASGKEAVPVGDDTAQHRTPPLAATPDNETPPSHPPGAQNPHLNGNDAAMQPPLTLSPLQILLDPCISGIDEGASTASSSSPFYTRQFWSALRRAAEDEGLESEVRTLFDDCKAGIRKRGGLPLLVEAELRFARLIAGLHGGAARAEASQLAASVQLTAEMLPLPEDRLVALTEAADVLGAVGAVRKRVLLMWQAVELSRYFRFPDARTLVVARRALMPAADAGDEWNASNRPLSQETCVSPSWSLVKAGCLEATLGLAIYAKRHADVFDAAAALLREHADDLSPHRMQSLLDNMLAAATHMLPAERARPGKGPPPLLHSPHARPLPSPQRPRRFALRNGDADATSPSGQHQGPFLYDPFAAKRRQERQNMKKDGRHGGGGSRGVASNRAGSGLGWSGEGGGGDVDSVEWVVGETAVMDIEVSNPACVAIKIDKMVLEAQFTPRHPVLPHSSTPLAATKTYWKPKPVSINIPAFTKPVRIQLEGTPLAPGTLHVVGCRLTAFGGVTWVQPWSPQRLGQESNIAARLSLPKKRSSVHALPPSSARGPGKNATTTSHAVDIEVLPALPMIAVLLQDGVDAVRSSQPGHTATSVTQVDADGSHLHHPDGNSSRHHAEWGVVRHVHGQQTSSNNKGGASSTTTTTTAVTAASHGALHGHQQGACVSVRVLQGQTLNASLLVTNNGKLQVDTLVVRCERLNSYNVIDNGGGRQNVSAGGNKALTDVFTRSSNLSSREKKAMVSFEIGCKGVAEALPLLPGQTASLPVVVSAASHHPSSSSPYRPAHDDRLVRCEEYAISVDYSAAAAAAAAAAAVASRSQGGDAEGPAGAAGAHTTTMTATDAVLSDKELLGRRAELTADVTVTPSLRVSHVKFREVHLPVAASTSIETQGSGARPMTQADVAPHSYQAGVVMLVEAMNLSRLPLNACLVCSTPDAKEQPQPLPVRLQPGQRGTLPLLIDAAASRAAAHAGSYRSREVSSRKADVGVQGDGIPTNKALSYEERERETCSAWLSNHVRIHFTPSSLGAEDVASDDSIKQSLTAEPFGRVSIAREEIFAVLHSNVLGLLRPPAIVARLYAGAGGGDCTSVGSPQLVRGMEVGAAHAHDNSEEVGAHAYPAVCVNAGESFAITVELENAADSVVDVECSLDCLPVEASPGSSHWSDAGHAAWVGLHSRIRLRIEPGAKVKHVAGLMLVGAGLYRVGLGHVKCREQSGEGGGGGGSVAAGQQRERNGLIAVHACFVNVLLVDNDE